MAGLATKATAAAVTSVIPKVTHEPESPLFTDVINQYMAYAKINVKANTYDKYESATRNHILPYFMAKGIEIAQLDTLDIQDYYTDRINTANLSKESVKYHRTVINQSLEYAISTLKLIKHNPATGIRLGKPPTPVIRFYEPEQLVDLIDKISGEGNQIIAPVILAAYYGLRREEVLGLEWSAVDFNRNKLTVRRTAIKTSAGILYENTVKSKSSLRSMPLFPEVSVYLKDLQRQQRQMQAMLKKAYHKNDAVCKWDDGRLVSPDYVTHRFKELLEKYGLPPLTFHQLRHSSASLLINNGYSLKEVQEWLGHADIKSTDVYSHLLYKSKENMAKTVGSTLSIPKSALTSGYPELRVEK
jgi:integrase